MSVPPRDPRGRDRVGEEVAGEPAVAELVDAMVCPSCEGPLRRDGDEALVCGDDERTFPRRDGVWRMLDATTESEVEGFLTHYREVRQAEGWGSSEAEHYRALPFEDTSGRHPEIWHIRAVSYRALVRQLLSAGPARVLDLGAGNCWLSYRLAELGHAVAAVDVNDDRRDGLGAHIRYGSPTLFAAVQASFDRLPWPDGYADLVVFNGSLHYSTDYANTLSEARRVLRPGGRIAVLDSPFYRHEASGKEMVRERAEEFRATYGEGAGAVSNEGFLTQARLRSLGDDLGVDWRFTTPAYGLKWAVRPLLNRLQGRREPARFHLVVGSLRRRD